MPGLLRVLLIAALAAAPSAFGQSGLRLPERQPGIDPGLARGWLAPDFDRFGFATFHWKDAAGFAPSPRSHWSYSFSERSSLGMSFSPAREFDYERRQMSLYGRYWLSPDWALSAETLSRDPGGLFRLQDFRIGVQRRF